MTRRHRQSAKHDGVASPQHAVSDDAAQDRRQIDERDIDAEGLCGERPGRKRTCEIFDGAAKRVKSGDVFDVAGQK
jgi:hypothetical protein